VLEVRYRGRSIDQVLDMTVHEAVHFFSGQPAVVRRLKLFEEIGLGYLRLVHSATTLSGGEAQRIKLAAHLARKAGQRVLYVLDEPTTGLHLGDINELLGCLQRLLEAGATLLVIEHNMDVVKQADWVIDLGPEGGVEGGGLVFQGTPEALAAPAARPSFDDLVANLKSPNAGTRREAAAELGRSRRREAVTPLAALVRDPDGKVRLEVVRALRELRDLSAVPAIVTSLSDG